MVQRSMEEVEGKGSSCRRDSRNTVPTLFPRVGLGICEGNGEPTQGGNEKSEMEDGVGEASAELCQVREEAGKAYWNHEGGGVTEKGRTVDEDCDVTRLADSLKIRGCQTYAIESGEEDSRYRSCMGVSSSTTTQVRSIGEETFSKGLCLPQGDASGISKSITECGAVGYEENLRLHQADLSGIFTPLIQEGKHGISGSTAKDVREANLSDDPPHSDERFKDGKDLFELSSLSHEGEQVTVTTCRNSSREDKSIYGEGIEKPFVPKYKVRRFFGNVEVEIGWSGVARAEEQLEKIIMGLGDAIFKLDTQEVSIDLFPSISESWPGFLLRSIQGEIKIMRPRTICKSDLAPIGSEGLYIDKIVSHLAKTNEDSTLLYLIRRFITAAIDEEIDRQPLADHGEDYRKPSYNFSPQDLKILHDAKLLIATDARDVMKVFKVGKKDGKGRFIMDCRRLNERFKGEHKHFSMDNDSLEEVIRAAERFPICISTDADAYFFQFRLTKKAALRFPLRIGALRGEARYFLLGALPMGFTFAPAIAQRTSNIIIRAVRQWMTEKGIQGEVFAWIDNYLVFANDINTAEAIMKVMTDRLSHFGIKYKPVDRSGEFLGLHVTSEGVKLTDKFVEKAKRKLTEFKDIKSPTFNDFLTVSGHLIWANTTVVRQPLCQSTAVLEAIRLAARDMDAVMDEFLVRRVLRELEVWERNLGAVLKRASETKEYQLGWSDATPLSIAIVIEDGDRDRVATAKFVRQIPIFIAELMAAAWASLCSRKLVRNLIDNTGAAYAIAKGHSTSETANKIIKMIYDHRRPESVWWVSTKEERADGPSRGAMPLQKKENYVSCKKLSSFFTY